MAGYFEYSNIDDIRNKVTEVYKNSKEIHVTLIANRKRINGVKATIVGVYNNFFCVKSLVNSYLENFTINYIDILTKKILIEEIE